MNSQFDFFSLQSLIPLVIIVGSSWFWLDMRSILKSLQRKNQLSIEGRWKDLEQHFEATSRSRRPFVWFYRKYLMPGNEATQYALFLYKQGRLEEALTKVDDAIRQITGKPRIFCGFYRSETFKTLCGSLRARVLILTGLGFYDAARETAARLDEFTASSGRPHSSLALLEYYCGHLDEALANAQAVPPGDPQYDGMRAVTTLVLCMKGEFDQALAALEYEPGDVTKFFSPGGLQTLRASSVGADLIELKRKKLAGVFQPARLLMLAQVHIAREEFPGADRALDEAEKSMGPEPGIQTSYCRYRACSLAAQGKAAEVETYIRRMRAIVQQLPKRSLLWETHFASGRAYLYLRRFSAALAELTEAQRSVLHPIEKHTTAYWMARTHEAAGNRVEAARYFQLVAADTIPSWMRQQSLEALAQPRT